VSRSPRPTSCPPPKPTATSSGSARWAQREARRQAAAWKATLPAEESGLAPDALVIERTESAFLRDLPASRSSLHGLRDLGVLVALDDFGTGYSFLSNLRRLPVDAVKLDGSFVGDLLGDQQGSRVTRALIELSRNLGTVLVAEGVEQPAQVTALVEQGFRLAQGFPMSRPVAAQDFVALLDQCLLPAGATSAADCARGVTAGATSA